jgi:phenylacetate-CoA ligase
MSVAESYWNAEIETQPARERAAMQLDKLRRQLAYVVDRSPFYARKFADAGFDASRLGNLDDLRHAPFTTKEELRESQIASPPLGDYAAADLRDVIRIHSSSGTTGRPSYVGITRQDRDTWT